MSDKFWIVFQQLAVVGVSQRLLPAAACPNVETRLAVHFRSDLEYSSHLLSYT